MSPIRIGTALVLCVLLIGRAQADEPFKAQEPAPEDAKQLVAAVQDQKTADGSTVLEALQYAEKLRPSKFKLSGPIDFGYSSDGSLYSVDACYWVGAKRLPGDAYCDISWEVAPDHKHVIPLPDHDPAGTVPQTMTRALMEGRDAFLRAIDQTYKDDCVDFSTGEKTC